MISFIICLALLIGGYFVYGKVVENNGDSPAQLEFQLPVEASGAVDLLADTVGAQPVLTSMEWGRMKVQLPSNYATILQLE